MLEFLDTPLVHRLGWTLVHLVWQGTAIGLIALVLLPLIRHRSAAARYNVLLGLFLLLVACPLATFLLVSPPETPLKSEFSAAEPGEAENAPAAEEEFPSSPREFASIEAVAFQAEPLVPVSDKSISREVLSPQVHEESLLAQRTASPSDDKGHVELASADRKLTGPSASADQSGLVAHAVAAAAPWLVLLWCVGVALLTARLGSMWWVLHRLVSRRSAPLHEAWLNQAEALRDSLGVRRAVRFLESSAAQVPMVVGWLRPVLLMPASVLTGLRPSEVEALFVHELAHIRRLDDLVNLLQAVAETLLFYHPVVWWLSAQLRREREFCCDDLATAVTGDGVAYSRALVAAAELAIQPSSKLTVAAVDRPANDGDLMTRVRRLLNPQPQPAVGGLARCGLVATLVCLLVILTTGATLYRNAAVAETPPPAEESAPEKPDPVSSGDAEKEATPEESRSDPPSENAPREDTPVKAGNSSFRDKNKLPPGAVLRFGSTRYSTGSRIVRFMPDGKHLVVGVRAAGTWFNHVSDKLQPAAVMDAGTGKIVRRLGPATTKDFKWTAITISGDGRRIVFEKMSIQAIGAWTYPGVRGILEVYDTKTGKLVSTLHNAIVSTPNTCSMNFDGSRIALASARSKDIELWDAAEGKKLTSTKSKNRHSIDSVAIDREGRAVAIAGPGDVFLWDTEDGSMSVFEERGATAVTFSPDGKYIGTGRGGAPETRLWNRETGEKLHQFKISGALVVAFTPDSKRYIAPSGYRNELEVREVVSGKLLRKITTKGIQIVDLSVSPDGKRLAVTGHNPGVGIWDLETGKQIASNGSGHDEAVRHMRYSPDGKRVVTAGMDGRVAIWDASTGELLQEPLVGSQNWAGAAEFSRDGKLVVTSSLADKNHVWDIATGKEIGRFKGHGSTGARYSIAAPGDGRLISFGVDGRLRISDIKTGEASVEHVIIPGRTGRSGTHNPSAISADGSTFAVSIGKEIQVYDVASGKRRASIKTTGDFAVALSPDGKLVATPFDLYDASSAEHLLTFGVGSGRAPDVAFSADGLWVAAVTGAQGATGRNNLWLINVRTNETLQLPGPPVHPMAVAVDPKGRKVAVACGDNSMFVYSTKSFAVAGMYPTVPGPRVRTLVTSQKKLKKISGRVVDELDRPVSGVRVLLRERPSGNEVRESFLGFDRSSDIADTWTSPDGRFEFKDIPCEGHPRPTYTKKTGGPYDIVVAPDERRRGGSRRRPPLAVTWAHIDDGAELTLKCGPSDSLEGQVTDLDGKPVAGALVFVRYFMSIRHVTQADLTEGRWPVFTDPAFLQLKASQQGPVVKTNAEGKYQLVNLPAGSGVILEVEHPQFVSQLQYAVTATQIPKEYQRPRKRNVQISPLKTKLDPGHHFKGRIIYEDTGELAKGAIIQRFNYREQKRIEDVREDGTFELKHVPSGLFGIGIRPPDGEMIKNGGRYTWGGLQMWLSPKERKHEVTIRLPTAEGSELNDRRDKFLDRMENIVPGFPPRRPRYHFRDSRGEIVRMNFEKKKFQKGDLQIINSFPFLEILSLKDSSVKNGELADLTGHPTLRELDLGWNSQLNSGVRQLGQLPKLEHLNLRNTRVTDNDLDFLAGLPALKILDLSGTKLTNSGLKKLVSITNLKNLELLRLGDLSSIDDSGLEQLKSLEKLKGLTINETGATGSGLAKLKGFEWAATPDVTVKEFIRRAEAGEFEHLRRMCSPGVYLPPSGKYKLTINEKQERSERNIKNDEYPYRLEFEWEPGEGRKMRTIYIELHVDRGSIFGRQVGLKE